MILTGCNRGAVYVLFLNSNGTVKTSQKIASGVGGGPILADQRPLWQYPSLR